MKKMRIPNGQIVDIDNYNDELYTLYMECMENNIFPPTYSLHLILQNHNTFNDINICTMGGYKHDSKLIDYDKVKKDFRIKVFGDMLIIAIPEFVMSNGHELKSYTKLMMYRIINVDDSKSIEYIDTLLHHTTDGYERFFTNNIVIFNNKLMVVVDLLGKVGGKKRKELYCFEIKDDKLARIKTFINLPIDKEIDSICFDTSSDSLLVKLEDKELYRVIKRCYEYNLEPCSDYPIDIDLNKAVFTKEGIYTYIKDGVFHYINYDNNSRILEGDYGSKIIEYRNELITF